MNLYSRVVVDRKPIVRRAFGGSLVLAIVSWLLIGCAPPEKPIPPDQVKSLRPLDKDYSHTQMTESKECKVEIEFPEKAADAPLNRPFDMIVRIKKADGSAGGKFAIDINRELAGVKTAANLAIMPRHGHGMDVLPRLVRVDDNTFRITGMLFHMPGWWAIAFDVSEGCGSGKIAFNTYLEPNTLDLSKLATGTKVTFSPAEFAQILSLSPLPALPASPTNRYADDPKAAHLGQYLFYDTGLSMPPGGGPGISCATCHDPKKGWGDERILSKGVAVLGRHSPSLWNVAYNRWFFWDGRADSLWSQALKPMEDANEMAGNRVSILLYFQKTPTLSKAYQAVFGEAVPAIADLPGTGAKPVPCPASAEGDEERMKALKCGKYNDFHLAWEKLGKEKQAQVNRFFSHLGKAIAAFERKIISKNSAFDTFVTGIRENQPDKLNVLDQAAQEGLKIFIAEDSCVTCHNGPNLTNREFHNIGLLDTDRPDGAAFPDLGRSKGLSALLGDTFGALGPFSDNPDKDAPHNAKLKFLGIGNNHAVHQFKTPTLRNIANTKPYMHDGRFKDLDAVVAFYSHFGLDPKDESKCATDAPKPAIRHELASKFGLSGQPKGCPLPFAANGREEFLLLLLLKKAERDKLVTFLKSLTGEALPAALLQPLDSPLAE